MLRLVCSNRGQHRPVVLLQVPAGLGATTPAAGWWRSEAARQLACKRCPRNPRVSGERMDDLLELAAGQPDRRLDLSFLDL
jgi:hypothetical protein